MEAGRGHERPFPHPLDQVHGFRLLGSIWRQALPAPMNGIGEVPIQIYAVPAATGHYLRSQVFDIARLPAMPASNREKTPLCILSGVCIDMGEGGVGVGGKEGGGGGGGGGWLNSGAVSVMDKTPARMQLD